MEVPELSRYRVSPNEYVPSLAPVFFNPLMELSRDISVSAVQVSSDEMGGLRICDPLAGVGARALRYAKEVEGTFVVANDRSPLAEELIRRNVELNGLRNVEIHRRDANALLADYRPRFHIVDLDPFGSPAPFIDAASSALLPGGMLFVTATDTAPLCGAHPRACLRRYAARPLRTEYCKELGLRILIGFCQRVAAKRDLALVPVLAYSVRHYFRVHMRVRRGARLADDVLSEQGYVSHCRECGERVITRGLVAHLPGECECGGKLQHAGPLWLGKLADKVFVRRVLGDLSRRGFRLSSREMGLLNRCAEEAGGPPTFYDLHRLARMVRTSPPRIRRVIVALRSRGYFASRTHLSGVGVRTDAPRDLVLSVVSKG